MDRLQRRSGCDFSFDCLCSVTADTDGHWSGAGKRNNQTQQACSKCGNTDHPSAYCPHSQTKRAENVERLVIWQVCVDLLEILSPRPRVVRRAREVAKVRTLPRLVGTVVRVDTCRRSVPRRRSMRWKNPPLRVRLAAKTQSLRRITQVF